MQSILYELYDGDYDIGTYRDREEDAVSQKLTPLLDKVKREFGPDFVDRLTNLYVDQAALSNFRHYREGFRLGVRLMLEVFTSPTV